MAAWQVRMHNLQCPQSRGAHSYPLPRHAHINRRNLGRPCLAVVEERQANSIAEVPPPTKTGKERLNDPAHIGAIGHASAQVQAYPEPVSLTQYMTLPVEQYFVLDPKQIRHLGGNRFLLVVPRIKIANVWLEPEVEVSVSTQAKTEDGRPKVVLQAENCRIRGSDLIENLRIDQRFCMRFVTQLTWEAPTCNSSEPSSHNSSNHGKSHAAHVSTEPSTGSQQGIATIGQGSIHGDAHLDVWCEVVQPFHLMPRKMLESTCNAVMRSLVGTLLPMFVKDLSKDYAKWATDPAYRAARAARSKPLSR